MLLVDTMMYIILKIALICQLMFGLNMSKAKKSDTVNCGVIKKIVSN